MQELSGAGLTKMLYAAEQTLIKERQRINDLNVFPVPDGDTGTNMSLTLSSAVKELENLQDASLAKVAQAVAKGSLMGARGNSGVILSQFFRGFAEGLKDASEASQTQLALAFKTAADTTYRAVMKPVEGTMLTVARKMAAEAEESVKKAESLDEFLEAVLKAARIAVADTPKLLARLREAGVVDAGGEGLVVILSGMIAGLRGETTYVPPVEKEVVLVKKKEGITRIEGVLENRYCTEFLIRGYKLNIPDIQGTLNAYGDSMVVVGDDEIVKVHIHTDFPGKVLDYCGSKGQLGDIKIDNMQWQNEAITQEEAAPDLEPWNTPIPIRKQVGVVAVVPGVQLAEIFSTLGTDFVVPGGQTMNPSTEELVQAVEAVPASCVIILPNNKNVIFSAQQVQSLVDKEVHVVTSRSIPQGISALMQFNAENSAKENLQTMEGGLSAVKTGEVTFAVRSSKTGELQIEEEDIIGLVEGKIIAVGQSVRDIAEELLDHMVDEESSMVSIYTGDNQDLKEAEAFLLAMKDKYPHCDVEVYQGGQPLYYYILSVE